MFDLFSDPVKVANQMQIIYSEYGFAIWETLYSLALEVLFAYVIGLPLGVLLVTGEREGVKPLPKPVMTVMNVVINLLRSVPFLILMIICLPLSKVIVGTKVGTIATIPPMVIAAFPLVARMVEGSLREVDQGVVEAAQSMGASPWQIVTKVAILVQPLTSHWPLSFDPVATTVPSLRRPTVWNAPVLTATMSVQLSVSHSP